MNIKTITDYVKPIKIINQQTTNITGICYNSKNAKEGDIFVCLRGEHSDGHEWAQSAYDKGVRTFMCEHELNLPAQQLIVNSTRHQIADLATIFYNEPSKNINLMGITGTNGKTTVTHLVQRIFEANEQNCSLIGTLGYKCSSADSYHEAVHTTPQAPELQAVLRKIVDNDIKNVVMEVSSHSLEQNRVGGCDFNGAVLTNLTQDHLDYHITMDNYFEAKALLFKKLKSGNYAIINADDPYASRFISVISPDVEIYTYGIVNDFVDTELDVAAKNVEFAHDGVKFDCCVNNQIKSIQLQSNGMFSVYNALAALAVGIANKIPFEICISALERTQGVAGRFETVVKKPLVIVDYAHTPDGLKNVLKAARELTHHDANLICLFGCGGDRDATKRSKMGKIADELADKVIVTSDNPRSEDPNLIISDIMTGIKSVDSQRIFVEPDRELAIKFISKIVNENDVVIIAGKGHENYQILKDKTIHFDDKEVVLKVFHKETV